ncbi:Eco57I restriction-modification methylase domain-containing protein [Canibacter zhoujuaniae]|uniref:Eco57I restriction-modification methylase domain-containing protein n=1 Tax=Canibacter zhoujuaniae TaxID=2708343 RepID=UPI001421A8A3|nr:Eco57I restriction-modification methylase domain-containing protein [Canibacter zhoujuaniae]
MSISNLLLSSHNPDVLTCIANLSNDEVFTPPEMAAAMLDLAAEAWARDHDGESLWANPNVRVLDPFVKTGVFLREATRRFNEGLITVIPDAQERVNHILTKQIYGIAITELTALMSRRSVYCSKYADSEHSICTAFDTPEGNIWFERTEHTWDDKTGTRESRIDPLSGKEIFIRTGRRCSYCGAGEEDYGRGEDLETHAYAFIHTDDIKQRISEIFGDDMHFDLIVGNPPYQLSDGGFGKSAAPIYQNFVEQAKALDPRYLTMIVPSRWFAGGKGLDEFRAAMLNDRRLRALVDYPKLYEAFPGVKIRGGVSYFLWSRTYDGPCSIQTMWDGKPTGPAVERYLNEFDVLVRRNEAVPILKKVLARREESIEGQISSRKPFGFRTFFHGKESPRSMQDPIKLFGSQKISWIERDEIPAHPEWIDDWKVFMTAVQGTSAAVETMFLSRPIIAEPGTACTETYIMVGSFDSREEAESLASYLRTRFVRFLVSLRKSTQHATRNVYSFVPAQSWDREWTDEELYAKYGLTEEEIAFIESIVRPMEDD